MLLVVGWDGACWELADRFVAAGAMPNLQRLLAEGRALDVESTIPPVTFPAWTTFMTGASPARHGVTDFTVRRPGSYGVSFVNSTHRRLPTIWKQMAQAGARVGVYAMPATYPAEGVCEVEVCGFDTPLGASQARGFCQPPELGDAIVRRYGALAVEGVPQARIGKGWHEGALQKLVGSIRLRTRIVADLLRERSFDVFAVHYMESDTVSHHFWQFDDEASPRHRGDGPARAIADVYHELDQALGELLAAAGENASLLLLSDHGSGGASDRAIAWNRLLADKGLLAFAPRAPGNGLARALRGAALRALPQRWQAPLFRALPEVASRVESATRLAGIDWEGTLAYSEELPYQPSLWLNRKGREPRGVVAAADADAVLSDLSAMLLSLRDPIDGERVVASVRTREEVCEGPFAHQVPDLVLELRAPGGYAYGALPSRGGTEKQWLRRLAPAEGEGAKGGHTSGVHRSMGMGVLWGKGSGAARGSDAKARERCSLADAGATALALAGVAPAPSIEGTALVESPVRPASRPSSLHDESAGPVPYSIEQETQVAERLRALGYLP